MGDDHAVPVLLAVAGALAVWPGRAGSVTARVRLLARLTSARRPWAGTSRLLHSVPRRCGAALAGLSVAVLIGGAGGLAAGLVTAAGCELLLRRAGPAEEADGLLDGDVPLVCDLLAVCLQAGLPPGTAVAAVADTVDEPWRTCLRRVAGLYRLGADPARAWAEVPAGWAAVGRAFVRAGDSGSAAVPGLRAAAADSRASVRSRAEAAVRRAGVWVLAPLGACFLPAFVCLGVVPLVLGIARGVFG